MQDLAAPAGPSSQSSASNQSLPERKPTHSKAQETPEKPARDSEPGVEGQTDPSPISQTSPEALPPLASLFGPPQPASQNRGSAASSRSASPQLPQLKAQATSAAPEPSTKSHTDLTTSTSPSALPQSDKLTSKNPGEAVELGRGLSKQEAPLPLFSEAEASSPPDGNEQIAGLSAPRDPEPLSHSTHERATGSEPSTSDEQFKAGQEQSKPDPKASSAISNGKGVAADAVAEAIKAATAASGGAGVGLDSRCDSAGCQRQYCP